MEQKLVQLLDLEFILEIIKCLKVPKQLRAKDSTTRKTQQTHPQATEYSSAPGLEYQQTAHHYYCHSLCLPWHSSQFRLLLPGSSCLVALHSSASGSLPCYCTFPPSSSCPRSRCSRRRQWYCHISLTKYIPSLPCRYGSSCHMTK
jgi:hypothetical protein